MAMKYLGAYLMSVIGGNESPTAEDITSILDAGGIAYEKDMVKMVVERMDGKKAHELISTGYGKFAACGGGGGGGGGGAAAAAPEAAAAGGGGGKAAAKKEEVVEEEEEAMDLTSLDEASAEALHFESLDLPRGRARVAMATMKYLGAYLMSVIGGNESPTAEDITSILDAGGIAYEKDMVKMVVERMDGKKAHELISTGYGKFAACGGGGGG
eukprot:CAMPEP_0170589610 /NCGR_PEP_ID=MMETSP0224-20130122/11437_1 /TAXON_ID=285029 /ORGANISM="Togula jolla, Strain CCCM 725" /LENGTH=212 /DNA_ID=CAMNT_0010913369 /DNA_START=77 /DNA_END=714 /DNA_ORIENTATION=-